MSEVIRGETSSCEVCGLSERVPDVDLSICPLCETVLCDGCSEEHDTATCVQVQNGLGLRPAGKDGA